MKKRIMDGEIETAKRTSRIMIIVVTIILLLLIGSIIYAGFLYKEGKLFIKEEETVIKSNNSKRKEIDITDTNINYLYDIVKVTNDSCVDGSYQNKSSIKVSDLSTKCKYSIAKNKYKEYVRYDQATNITYVSEDKVKEAYQSIFGNKSYEKQEDIPYVYAHDMMYDSRYEYYFVSGKYEDPDTSLKSYETMIKAEKKNNDLYITSAVLYYESVNSVICKDSKCEAVIEELSKNEEHGEEYFKLYLEHNQNKLYHYTYHFILNDIGFYEYKGYDRITP